MSALPPEAGITERDHHVRFGPNADIRPKQQCGTLWTNEAVVFALSGESARFKQNKGGTENGQDNFS
jgi:hypothetical protein